MGTQPQSTYRVLQVATGLVWGGAERHVAMLLRAFADSGQSNQQLAVFHDGRLAEEVRRAGGSVHLVRKRFRGDIGTVFRLAELIRRERIDIVHTHLLGGNLYGRLAARWAGARCVVSTLHMISPDALSDSTPPLTARFFFRMDLAMAGLSDHMVTTSEAMRRHLIAGGIPADRLTTIVNGVDVDRLRASEADRMAVRREYGLPDVARVVGMAGRLVPVKNFDLFLRAARRVVGTVPSAVFMVIGDGPLASELSAAVGRMGLAGRVIFTGFRDDMPRLLSAIDLAVLCSNSETTPYAVTEAMAMGKAVVATAVGGIPEQIESGRNGLLCPPGDEGALAEAISTLLSDPERLAEMGRCARARAMAEFSLACTVGKLQAVYECSLDSRRRDGRSRPLEGG